jgi:adenine-specific DNA-methyltransferase
MDQYEIDKLLKQITELQQELNASKKYGLVWDKENTEEEIVNQCKTKIPVLQNFPEKNLSNSTGNNILIEGDNFHVLTCLNYVLKESVDLIYIDPPYNTGHEDFAYNDSFVNYDDSFIHSKWLSFMNKRLVLARDLLKDDGLIFISIDDGEQANLKLLCDSIFGNLNFVNTFIIDKTAQGANNSSTFKTQHEYCLMYKKNSADGINYNVNADIDSTKYKYKDERGYYAITNSFDSINSPLSKNKNRGYTVYYRELDKKVEVRDEYNKETESFGPYCQSLLNDGFVPIRPGIRKNVQYPWNWMLSRFLDEYSKELVFQKNRAGKFTIYHKNRFNGLTKDSTIKRFDTRQFGNQLLVDILGTKKFDYPKSIDMMKWVVDRHLNKSALILDFFAGSGTTGQAVLELNKEDGGNRRFILCTNNENNICTDVTYPRLKTVITGIRPDCSMYSDGIPSNLYYFKTGFVEDLKNSDQTKYNLAEKVDSLLCIKEDIFDEKERNEYSSHFVSSDKKRHLFIYNDYFNKEKFDEFKERVIKAEGEKVVYVFSFDNNVDETLFSDKSIIVKPIPEKIYEIYKEIAESIKRGE